VERSGKSVGRLKAIGRGSQATARAPTHRHLLSPSRLPKPRPQRHGRIGPVACPVPGAALPRFARSTAAAMAVRLCRVARKCAERLGHGAVSAAPVRLACE
jgi:hypothetical protein